MYLAQYALFDQVPALRADVCEPDYTALVDGDVADGFGDGPCRRVVCRGVVGKVGCAGGELVAAEAERFAEVEATAEQHAGEKQEGGKDGGTG